MYVRVGGQPCQALAFAARREVDDFGGKGHAPLGVGLVGEIDAGAGLEALAGPHEHFPQGARVGRSPAGVVLAQKEDFGFAARFVLVAQQAGGHDAGFVGHQHVARLDVVDDVAEDLIFKGAGRAVHYEHLARVAHGPGLLGDAVFG